MIASIGNAAGILARIRYVEPFDALPRLVDELIAGRNRGRAVMAVQATA